MFLLKFSLLTLSLLVVCESSFVDKLPKCSIRDSECICRSYQLVKGYNVGKNGIPELDIPPFDPMKLSNLTVTLLDSVTVNITEGNCKGTANCVFKNFTVDLVKSTVFQEIACETLYIKGHFLLSGKGNLIKSFAGTNEITGQGKAKVKLENLYFSLVFPFKPIKKDDGEIYMTVANKGIKYKYDIGKATFATENVSFDNSKDDLSDVVTAFLNTSWKSLLDSFGSEIVNTAKDIFIAFEKKFFESLPTKFFFIEDLTPYVKNELS